MTKSVFLPLYNWTLWIMAKISLQAGHEILPNSPTEEGITLPCSRCEYCLAQPIVAQYEIFFQKAAHSRSKESDYDDFTINA